MQLVELLAVVLIGLTSFTCSATNLQLENIGNKQIYFHNASINWFEAFQFCASHQLRLMTIDNSLENFHLSEYLKSNKIQFIWTSGTDLAKEGEWMWMSTGRAFTFNDFFAPRPDNYNHGDKCTTEDCLLVGYYPAQHCMIWEDVRCNDNFQFICEEIL